MISSDGALRGERLASSLDALIGSLPEALERMYRAGRALSPQELGPEPRTRLLAMAPISSLSLAVRPLVRAYAGAHSLQLDKQFDADGRAGRDVIRGKIWCRFRLSPASSELDGLPTLLISYAHKDDRNRWPVPMIYDELRMISRGLAIGPTLVRGSRLPLCWFGMEDPRRG